MTKIYPEITKILAAWGWVVGIMMKNDTVKLMLVLCMNKCKKFRYFLLFILMKSSSFGYHVYHEIATFSCNLLKYILLHLLCVINFVIASFSCILLKYIVLHLFCVINLVSECFNNQEKGCFWGPTYGISTPWKLPWCN